MARFTAVLEEVYTETMVARDNSWQTPPRIVQTFHSTQAIDARDLDDAWEIARIKWYILKELGPGVQIADIHPGEWEPPPPPVEQGATNGRGIGTQERSDRDDDDDT